MKRLLAQTLVIQCLGVLLLLGITLFVARIGGAEEQGRFALVKSINDLQVALFSLGLPSGLVFTLNKSGSGHRAAFQAVLIYTSCLLALATAVNFFTLAWLLPDTGTTSRLEQATLIAGASALLTGYGIQRGLVLVRTDGTLFSLVSILPAASLTIAIVVLLGRTGLAIEIAYAVSGVVCFTSTTLYLRRVLLSFPTPRSSPIDWAVLVRQSLHVFIQALLFSAQIFGTNAWMKSQDASLADLGLFNISSMVVTIPNLLIGLVAPVLFNRWSRSLPTSGLRGVFGGALLAGAITQGIALLAIPLVDSALGQIFGREFQGAARSTTILLFSIFAVTTSRILTPALQGLGHNHLVTWSCMARVGVAATFIWLARWAGTSFLDAVALGWLAAECAAAIFIMLAVRKVLSSGGYRGAG